MLKNLISVIQSYLRKLIALEKHPAKIARSIALGFFIGLSVPFGLQTVSCFPATLLFNTNLILTIIATQITNPVTTVPIYFTAMKIGEFITGIQFSWQNFVSLFNEFALETLFHLGRDGFLVMAVGCLTLAIITSVLAYYATLRLTTLYLSLKHK